MANKNHKTIEEVFELCLENLKEHNLTLDEFCKTFKIEKDFAEALLDPQNKMLNNISRFIESSGYRLTPRKYNITTHSHSYIGEFLLIKRLIEPKCSINYDFSEQKFFRLRKKNKHTIFSLTDKQNIISDFEKYLTEKVL